MLPLSCFLFSDSKSNSSMRLPRTTTTRVSSGWEASMSILLGIMSCLPGAGRRTQPRICAEYMRCSCQHAGILGVLTHKEEPTCRTGRGHEGAVSFGLEQGLACVHCVTCETII